MKCGIIKVYIVFLAMTFQYRKLTYNNIMRLVRFAFLLVFCLSVLTPPLLAQAQTTSLENGDVVREQETGKLYQVTSVQIGSKIKKYKRLLQDQQSVSTSLRANKTAIKSASKNTLSRYELNDLVLVPKNTQSNVVEYDMYRIFSNRTIKQLVMNENSAVSSGYVSAFYATQEEIDRQIYTKQDPIYFTGTTNSTSNVYKESGRLTEKENGNRIYRAVLPQGENQCSITGNVVAVIGKPGVEYATITSGASLSNLQGGNVLILLQQTSRDNTDSSFVLECRQVNPLHTETINTATLPAQKTTYTKTGTGEALLNITLPQGFHSCIITDSSGSTDNLQLTATNDANFNTLSVIPGGKTYIVNVKTQIANQSNFLEHWTIECHEPQNISLTQNMITLVQGTGYPYGFKLNWAPNTTMIQCKGYQNPDDANIVFYKDAGQKQSAFTLQPTTSTPNNPSAFLSINPRTINPHQKWTAVCKSQNTTLQTSQYNPNITPLVTSATKTTPHPTNNNPNLLRNVVAKADGINCANHLLDLDDVVGDTLLVSQDLCIQYTTINQLLTSGNYSSNESIIRVKRAR